MPCWPFKGKPRLSVISSLQDLDAQLAAVPSEQAAVVINAIRGVLQIALRTGIPVEVNDAIESAVMTIVTRVKLKGQGPVLEQVRLALPSLPFVARICNGLLPAADP